MIRLRNCAFGAFVITTTAAFAQDVQTTSDMTDQMAGMTPEIQAMGTGPVDDGEIRLGQDKQAPLCPTFCAPRRVTSVDQATVGERDVIAYTIALATNGPKLHVDSRRSAWAQVEKFPRATAPMTPTLATQNEFRPALDPVLAEPTADPVE